MDARDTNTGKTIKNQNIFKRAGSIFVKVSKKVIRIIVGKTLPQRLFRLYLIIIITGALLLCAPFCLNPIFNEQTKEWVQINGFAPVTINGIEYNFIKALFIACSGFSDTGLTPVNIYEYLNPGGQVVLIILIEVGGIGVVALFYYVWNFFKKKDDKIDVGQLYIMQAERGGSNLAQSFHVIKVALIFILITQVIFMFGYALCFTFIPAYEQQFAIVDNPWHGISFSDPTKPLPMYHNFGYSLWIGLFTTVSAMNNAGFDNISANSMSPFRNDIGIVFQMLIIIELIIGGLGHFVWFDVIEKMKCKAIGKRYKMSLYSKVAISVYVIVAVLGLAGTIACEFCNPRINSDLVVGHYSGRDILLKDLTIIGNRNQFGEFGKNTMLNKVFAIIFQTFNCRSLGMETIKTNTFAEGTKWVLVILMFIGASPCSTAGGIRTTTLAIIFVTIWCKLCGRKNVFFFKRRIQQETVTQAFMIFVISLLLLLIGVAILWSSTPITDPFYRQYPNLWFAFADFMVECASAFGTVGLSTGITAMTKWWGLLYLIILMFVGQLGVINTLLSWTRFHPHFNDIEYPYEDIKIG